MHIGHAQIQGGGGGGGAGGPDLPYWKITIFYRKKAIGPPPPTPPRNLNHLENIGPGPRPPGEISWTHACRHVIGKPVRVQYVHVQVDCFMYAQ